MHRHGRVVTLRGLPVARWHRGVQCCPRTIFGSSVERTAKLHPLCSAGAPGQSVWSMTALELVWAVELAEAGAWS
jgi:hypothetical protein